jgi:hypothetical protein
MFLDVNENQSVSVLREHMRQQMYGVRTVVIAGVGIATDDGIGFRTLIVMIPIKERRAA